MSVLVTFKLQHHQTTSKMRTTIFLVLLVVLLSIFAATIVNLELPGITEKCSVGGQQFFDGVTECVPCVGTCENPHPICPLVCQSGCACPQGTVLDGESCVNPKQCLARRPCRHSDGTVIDDGETYKLNPSTTCQCDNEKLLCAVKACAAPSCDEYTMPPGECCPVCTQPTSCRYNGQTYQPGESFPSNDAHGCSTCFCSEAGLVSCTKTPCLPKLECPTPTEFGICLEFCSSDEDCGPDGKCCSTGCGRACMADLMKNSQ